jgi:hypothetical protein
MFVEQDNTRWWYIWMYAYGERANKKNGCFACVDQELKTGIENATSLVNY